MKNTDRHSLTAKGLEYMTIEEKKLHAETIAPYIRMLCSKGNSMAQLRYYETKDECGGSNEGDTVSVPFTDNSDTLYDNLGTAISPKIESGKPFPFTVEVESVGCFKVTGPSKADFGRYAGKVVIITGGAQGFGKGIADHFIAEGARVVIADIKEETARKNIEAYEAEYGKGSALFVQCDVSNDASVHNLVQTAVLTYGGLDVFISNAGILIAGSLEKMDPASFELMTKVNYTAYFLCAKYAKAVMKIQHKADPTYYTDIIQINSKSGLAGSKNNFTYAGGKFGGIGLTQSFALECAEFNIKVNSVCPGNLFDGPLWSDPEKGLFVQYLKSNKVPGAKNVADVKAFYEAKVPLGRGCQVSDVVRGIFYLIDQKYETGQALPVTGGQVMLK